MEIWPAIDLRGGKCVRLQQGDYDRETVFGDDPADMARRWVREGAERLHLVDLDGARDGHAANQGAVQAILSAVHVPCELGGGIRSDEVIERWLSVGITRLVVGTQALKEPDWFRQACRRYPGKLVLGIDARDGMVATHGWRQVSGVSAMELAEEWKTEPVAAIVYTDISRDGMMAGPNLAAMRQMREAVDLPVVASGGITSREDVSRLAEIGMAGCIIGRALYEGSLRLPDAIDAARELLA